MAKRKDPKLEKMTAQLTSTVASIDIWTGRIIRAANKLSDLRNAKKRIQRNIAKHIAAQGVE